MKGNRTAAGLIVSGTEDAAYSSPNFGFVLVTFENDTDDWVRIERMNLGFGGGAKDASVKVPAGEQLESWAEAASQLNAIRNANTALILEAVAVAGSAVALSASNRSTRIAGAAVSTAAEAGLAGQAISAMGAYPLAHLLSVPFTIPPHLFSKRWVVLNTPTAPGTPCIDAMLLDYETARSQHERVRVRLRGDSQPFDEIGPSRSEWQRQACPQDAVRVSQ